MPLCVCFLLVSVSFCVSIYLRHHPRDNCLGPCRFRGTALRDGHRRVRIGAQKIHTLCCSIALLAFGLKPVAANDHSFLRTKRNTLFTHLNVTQNSACFLHTARIKGSVRPPEALSRVGQHINGLWLRRRGDGRRCLPLRLPGRLQRCVFTSFSSFSSCFWVGLS